MFAFISLCIDVHMYLGSVILLENLRFHVEEEGKGVDAEGKPVYIHICLHACINNY